MLAFENRLRELGEAVTDVKKVVNEVNDRANNKIDEMRKFVQEVGGRFDNLEQALPERIHKLEIRNDGLIETLNEVTKNIYNRFEEMNNLMTSANPPNFGGPTTAQTFNIGSADPLRLHRMHHHNRHLTLGQHLQNLVLHRHRLTRMHPTRIRLHLQIRDLARHLKVLTSHGTRGCGALLMPKSRRS